MFRVTYPHLAELALEPWSPGPKSRVLCPCPPARPVDMSSHLANNLFPGGHWVRVHRAEVKAVPKQYIKAPPYLTEDPLGDSWPLQGTLLGVRPRGRSTTSSAL